MNKPEPYRLSLDAYPYRTALQTRYADLDVNKHLNNVAIATLFEEGRVRMITSLYQPGDTSPLNTVIVAAQFAYLLEGKHGSDIEMACGVSKIGNTSWTILAAAFQKGQAIATCDVVAVYAKDGKAASISESWRERLSRYRISAPEA